MKRKTHSPTTAPAHLKLRVQDLQKRLQEANADALLVSNAVDIHYLTGFAGHDSWALIPARGQRVYILSDFRFQEEIARVAPHARTLIRTKGLSDELTALFAKLKLDRLALQVDHVTLATRSTLAKRLGARRLMELDDGLLAQRSVKDDREVRAIRRALKIQEQAYRDTLAYIEPGMTEREVAAYLEYRMRALGADGPSFPTIVAFDANASLPHAVPGDKKLRVGGSVLIDWGARWGGYCSDLTRVVAIGKMRPRVREIYQVVLEAQQAGIAAIAPGRLLREVDAAARTVIERAGFGPQFGHSLGHGIGLDIHEQPTLSPRSVGRLEVGQVVTVEPGIYLPGVGGVRIEDDVLVTATGGRVLSSLPTALESAII